MVAFQPDNHLEKDKKYGPDHEEEPDEIIPFESFLEVKNREPTEDDESDHLLNGFKLCG
jgi:hypothetical protein